MKKLVSASVVLLSVCSGTAMCTPAIAQTSFSGQSASSQPANCSPTIKDPAEYNAYTNAISQSSPAGKAQAIEQFLQQYPNSAAKTDLLGQLMVAYQQTNDVSKTLDAAKRLLQSDPANLRALTYVVYLEHTQSNGNQAALDQAAADAQKGLNAPKDSCMSQADYDQVKEAATPIFYSAIGADDQAKKDYKSEIDAYTKELQSYKNPAATTQVPGLLDTYYLGQAYLQEDPKDLKSAVWFLTRAAQFTKPPYQSQIETAAVYWYKKFHCAQNDAACMNGNPPPGFADIQQLAASPANVFPPASYNPTPAPPPPSPAELAHNAIVSTAGCTNVTPAPPSTPAAGAAPAVASASSAAAPGAPAPATSAPQECTDALKKGLGLSDEEFILANGDPADQQLIWSIMSGVTAQVPGVVVTATPDSVQLAVTQDAQQSNKADFTINMKEPLKTPPTAGAKVTYIATFDSYTQNPPMIVMKDGEPPAPEHKAVTHHPVHHTSRQ
ncbi:MAG TPA: hypothetical protein VIY53_15655 [Acidobacteriaceae bacterium]